MIDGMHQEKLSRGWLYHTKEDQIDRHMKSRDSQLQLVRCLEKALILWLQHKVNFR